MLRYSRRFFFVSGAVLAAILLTLIIVVATGIGRAALHVGEVAPDTLRAPRSVVYRSDLKTKEARDLQASKVQSVYLDKSILLKQQQQRIDSYTSGVDSIRTSNSQQQSLLENLKPVQLSADQADSILSLGPGQWSDLKSVLSGSINQLQSDTILSPIPSSELTKLIGVVDTSFAQAQLPTAAQPATEQMATQLLVANHVVDEGETSAHEQTARDSVSEVLVAIQSGEVLTLRGQVIDAFSLEKLQAVGLAKPHFSPQATLAILLLMLSLTGALSLYFYQFVRDVQRRKDYLMILAVIFLLSIAAIILLPLKPSISYIFPVPALAVMVALMVNTESALLVGVVSASLCAYLAGQSYEIGFIQAVGSVAGVLLSRNVARINAFGQVAGGIALWVAVSSIGFLLISGDFTFRLAGILVLSALANGIISVLLVLGGMIAFARYFDKPPFLQLLELENPSHPLLKQLVLKAPGTYQHSLVIANMAERAASAIGGDALMARTAAYYHDIGKINDPNWFVENQHDTNPHDKLKDPIKSAKKIISHVTDGIELARQFHLPEPIQHIISSHHGTMRVEYFYHLAHKKDAAVDSVIFTYPGPTPRTREAGLIMLADGIEARARSLTRQDQTSLQETVEYIIDERKKQGQLYDCGLTSADLEEISIAFVEVLSSVHQHRIKYPGQR
jgi:hypothetical protein